MQGRLMQRLMMALAIVIVAAGCDESSGPQEAPVGGFGILAEVDVGDRPLDIVVAGDRYIISNAFSSIMSIDPATMSVDDSLAFAGFFPHELLIPQGSSTIYLSDDASGKVRAVSLPDLDLVWTLTLPSLFDPFYSLPLGLVSDPDHEHRLYILEGRSGLIALVGITGAVLDTVHYREARGGSISGIENGYALAIDPVRDRLFVSNRTDGRVYSYSTSTLTKLDSIGTGSMDGVAANTLLTDTVNGHLLLNVPMAVLSGDSYIGTLAVYDSNTLSLVKEVDIPDWPDMGGLAWVEEGALLAVVSGTHLLEFSVPDYELLHDVDMEHSGTRVAYDSLRGYFIVTFWDEDLVRIYERADDETR